MIKLIKEFLRSGIEANQATTEAMNAATKSNNKAIEYYETIIYYDILIKSQQLQNEKPSKTYWETCSCNPANGGSGICGCTLGNLWRCTSTTAK